MVEFHRSSTPVQPATQAQMETATSTAVYSSPGQQHSHPGHPKAACRYSNSGTPTLVWNYKVTSLTDNAVGDTTLNLGVTFSSANDFMGIAVIASSSARMCTVLHPSATTFTVLTWSSAAAAVDVPVNAALWGDI